jgi:uncharacterized membrane protein YfcA
MDNLKFKAFRQTVGFCAITAILATILVYLITFIGPQAASWIFIIALLAGGFYIMYSVNLSRLQFEEKFPKKDE